MNDEIFILALISLIIGVIPLFLVKRDWKILLIAGLAYFSAIVIKALIQVTFLHIFQTPQIQTYLAYGLLTAVTEPGLAYLFVRFVKEYPQTYGVSLAFWENGVLVGLLALISAVEIPANLNLALVSPLLNEPITVVILGKIMDRLASLLLHYAWGVSAFWSYWRRDPKFILTIAPLGFVDSITAYMDLSHVNNYFALAIPAFSAGLLGYIITRYYLKSTKDEGKF